MDEGKNLFYYFRPYIKLFALALFCMTMVAVFTGLFAAIIQPVMDELFLKGGGSLVGKGNYIRDFIIRLLHLKENQTVFVLPQLLFFSFCGQAFFTFYSLYAMKTLGLKVVKDLREILYQKLIHHSIDFLSKSKTGDLVSRISNDIDKISVAVSETLAVLVRETLTFLMLVAVVFYQDWVMALFSMLLIPFAGVLLLLFGRRTKKRGLQSQQAMGELANFLYETVQGNKIIKAYNMEDFEIKKFNQLNKKHFQINKKIALIYSVSAPVMLVIGGLVAAFIFTFGMQRVANKVITPGQFTSFLAALFLMYNPLKRLSQANNEFQHGKAGFTRVQHVINEENPIKDKPSAIPLEMVQGKIDYFNVSFSYRPSAPVLRQITFSVKPGEMVALVGTSGAGKTTIINLLLRYYDMDGGRILIDNRDIRDFSLQSVRRAIGLVTQDVFLFNDSVLNNICVGNSHYSLAEVKEAAQIARAALFIDQLPHGYDTLVGDRGMLLSTGQRQRIAIARAVLKKPPILVFDEATSSLDSESEKLIQEAMVDLMKNRTTFVIAHRLSTIVKADTILVIEGGELRERGTHLQLLKKKGLYYSLYNLQFPEMDIII